MTNLEALSQVRQVFCNWEPGSPLPAAELRSALESPCAESSLEGECLFARGWLSWLLGEPEKAELLLEQSVRQFEQPGSAGDGSEGAYWLARVRLRLGRPEQIAAFEKVLRTRSGSPRITCWFVDLLWRAGQPERAEQVWKAVRSNRKVSATEEAALLEARLLLHHQEAARAERSLGEATLRNGVLQVERDLLVVWALITLKRPAHVAALLDLARQGPYPPGVVAAWQTVFELRQQPSAAPEAPLPDPPFLTSWQRGQQLRQDGQIEEAGIAFREALAFPQVRPFARYTLACLGTDDFAAILASQPGQFLTIRCRTQLVAQRFRQRKASAAEMLDALRQAEKNGFHLAEGSELRRLASILTQPSVTADELRAFAETDAAEPAVRRNRLRVALELADRRLSPPVALELLLLWSQQEISTADAERKRVLGEYLLRLVISGKAASTTEKAALDTAQSFLSPDPKTALARAWLQPQETIGLPEIPADDALARLWRAALLLSRGVPEPEVQRWRSEVSELRKVFRCRGLAQSLLVQEAAQRGDVPGLVGFLDEVESWTAFDVGPPGLVLRVLERVARSQPRSQRLRQSLARWLGNWKLTALEPTSRSLAGYAGFIPLDPKSAEPPSGTPVLPWLLHQAAQAVRREKYTEALAWVQRALAQGPASDLEETIRAALPDLERLARAQALGAVLRFHLEQPVSSPGLLIGFVALLEADVDGQAILSAGLRGETESARQLLSSLANRSTLAPPLAHHLALAYHRAALILEEREPPEAEACWALAWRCWLAVLASFPSTGEPEESEYRLLLERLLLLHRQAISDLLIRNEVDRARRHWERVHGLAKCAAEFNPSLGPILVEATTTFREELATEYLTATREAMRHGDIAPGWHADYEKGLAYLRRLLSLDRDNLRLLTALVEICTEWFLDCYNNEDARRLWEQVERFTPFALKLARMIENRSDALTARAALSDFYKFRGFIAEGRQQKIALYREALKFNPANENVRELLGEQEQMP